MRTAILLLLLAQILPPAGKPGHATILAAPTEVNGAAGGKLALFVDVAPKPGIHVYAPGSDTYIPITVKLNALPDLKVGKVAYPKSEIMTFADEKVPVFQKPFRLTQDVTLGKSLKAGSTVIVTGTVNYQACDDRVCYPPESSPVSWTVVVQKPKAEN
jgi:DsbC/DsbD-like thiol-disulfide interchange protein